MVPFQVNPSQLTEFSGLAWDQWRGAGGHPVIGSVLKERGQDLSPVIGHDVQMWLEQPWSLRGLAPQEGICLPDWAVCGAGGL